MEYFTRKRDSRDSLWHCLLLPRSCVGFPLTHEHPASQMVTLNTFLLQIPLVQNLLYSPGSGHWKQTCSSAQTETESQDYPGKKAELPSMGRPHQIHSVAYCPAEGKGKSHEVSGPFLLRIHRCSHWGAGTASHVTSKRRYRNSEKSGFHCPCITEEKTLSRCPVLGMGGGGWPDPRL